MFEAASAQYTEPSYITNAFILMGLIRNVMGEGSIQSENLGEGEVTLRFLWVNTSLVLRV